MVEKINISKLIIAVILTTILLGVGLFLPTGTIIWLEAWIWLGIFFIFFMTVVLYFNKHDPEMLKRRAKPKFAEKWDIVVMIFMGIGFLPIFIIPGFDFKFGWSNVPIWVKIIGFVGVVLGLVLVFFVMKENTFLSKTVEIQKDRGHVVITTGPYKIVRHPMYLGFTIFVVCYCFALGSLWSLIPTALGIVGLVIRTNLEDRLLHKELEGYTQYANRTRKKLIPFIW